MKFGLALLGVSATVLYFKNRGCTSVAILSIALSCAAFEIILYLAFHSFAYRWIFSSTRKLPYPKEERTFFFGNLGPFIAEPWGFPLARWQRDIPNTQSGFYRVFLGPFDYLIPKSASSVTAVMNQPYVFEKPAAVRDGLVESLGVGLVSAEGEEHRRQKDLLTPLFGLKRNKRLVPAMWAKSLILEQKLAEMVQESGESRIIYLHPLTMANALDVIGVTTLGVDFDSIRRPEQPILEAYRTVFPSFEHQGWYLKFIAALMAVISPHILFKLPLPSIRRFHRSMKVLRQFCIDQIQKKKLEIVTALPDDEEAREKDILSSIIASGLTDETQLVSHLLTILAAGHESTAITLAWALFKLAQYPDVQERLRDEIRASIDMTTGESPTLEQINSIKYLRCFLMEVLRLYPAFPAMMREASRHTIIKDLTIPQGQRLMVSPWAVNRSTELWGPDADEFRVERWLDSYSGGAKSSQAFLTFSSGPRICIGKDFAQISVKVALCVLINKFRFEEAEPGWYPEIQKGTSLKPIGLKIKIVNLSE